MQGQVTGRRGGVHAARRALARARPLQGVGVRTGGRGLSGGLGTGTGTGKWRLAVTANQPIEVMSLLSSPTGHVTNLSTVRGEVVQETAAEVFAERISGPIVQGKCIACHIPGGLAALTRLHFVGASAADHVAHNLGVFENFVSEVEDGATLILNKIQGVAHGGGVQVAAGTAEFADMERFLGMLGEDVTSAPLTPQTLFDTVTMAPARKVLRRAALIFAGRIPTDGEYAAAQGGPAALRETIRGLMTGPEFHEFLIRAANDRLLTARGSAIIDVTRGSFVDFTNENYRRAAAAHASGDKRDWIDWHDRVQHGFRRAPLELIAHVVENDLSYTEILTANYIMANPMAAAAYGASTRFDDPEDVNEFTPSRIVSYYRQGEGYEREFDSRYRGGTYPRSWPPDHGLSARRHSQHAGVPHSLPHDGHQPQPGALALDLLPLPRSRYREVRLADYRPGGARGHEQPDLTQPGLHGLPPRARPGGRSVPELR